MLDQQLIKSNFIGRDGFIWWVGQIPQSKFWKTNTPGTPVKWNKDIKGFDYRYKVRILGYHTASPDDLKDKDLPWASLMLPVTAGVSGGNIDTPQLMQGNFVYGFFLDGEEAQQPVIMGVIGYNQYTKVKKSITKNIKPFVPFSGYETPSNKNEEFVNKDDVGSSKDNKDNEEANNKQGIIGDSNTASEQIISGADKEQDYNKSKPKTLPTTSECDTIPVDKIQTRMKSMLNDVQRLNKSKKDWELKVSTTIDIAGLQKGIDNFEQLIDKEITKATKDITSEVKTIVTNIEKNVNQKVNDALKKSFHLVLPSQRKKMSKEVAKANDAMGCLFKNMGGNLNGLVNGFLKSASKKFVNAPLCAVEGFVGGMLGNITGILDTGVADALAPVKSMLGAVGDVTGSVGKIKNLSSGLTGGIGGVMVAADGLSGKVADIASGVGNISGGVGNLAGSVGNLTGGIDLSNLAGSTGGFPGLSGDLMGIATDALTILDCKPNPKCTSAKEWTPNGGPVTFATVDVASIINQAKGVASQVQESANQIKGLKGKVSGIGDKLKSIAGGDLLPKVGGLAGGIDIAGSCNTGPIFCGPPTISFDGGGGSGGKANAIIGAAGAILGIDIVLPGTGYIAPPKLKINDNCGKGKGASGIVEVKDGEIVKVIMEETGTGYLPFPDGSSGGDGTTFAEDDETIIQRSDGTYEVPLKPGNVVQVCPGDIVTKPGGIKETIKGDECVNITTEPKGDQIIPRGEDPSLNDGTYPVILELDDLAIGDPGVNYSPDDKVIIEPANGAEARIIVDELGSIDRVEVTKNGIGFQDEPEIFVESETGFNARLLPVFKINTDGIDGGIITAETRKRIPVIEVVDCVGKVGHLGES